MIKLGLIASSVLLNSVEKMHNLTVASFRNCYMYYNCV